MYRMSFHSKAHQTRCGRFARSHAIL